MTYSNTKKNFLTILFAGSMLFASVLPFTAYEMYAYNNFQVEKIDSTKVNSQDKKVKQVHKIDEKIQQTKSSSNLSYNIIYFLISKFIKVNPLSKPR